MTLAANVDYGSFQKFLLLRRMRAMTIQTANIINQGPVHPVFVKCLRNHIFVTLPAQLSGLLFGLEGVRRSGFLVTLGTLSLGNTSMGNIKYDSPCIGAMRVVAGVTVRLCHIVIHVLPFKSEFIGFMALHAEERHISFQEKI